MARFGWLTHEEIVGVGNITADAEELHQVVELAMDITTYLATPCD